MQETTVSANGVQFFVAFDGDPNGKPVLLLHGFPETWWQWRSTMQHLSERGYRVVAPNQRGYHRTSKPKHVRDYALDHLAQDAVSLMEALGYPQFDIIGHDWGGFVAWHVAQRFPQHVKKLVSLNSALMRVQERALLTRPKQMLKSWYVFFFQLPFLPEYLLRRGLTKWFFGRSSQPTAFTADDIAHYQQSWTQDNALWSMVAWYRNVTRSGVIAFYGELFRLRNPYKKFALSTTKIQTPTLVLWGERDAFLTKNIAETSIKLCENGQVIFYPNVSHWITHEIPAEINAQIETFLGQA